MKHWTVFVVGRSAIIQPEHWHSMQCLKAAMRDAGAEARMANRPDLRKEYVKLFSVASNNAQVSVMPNCSLLSVFVS